MQFPINTGPKEDHPQRVAKLVGVDPKYYYKAEELKLYEDAINALYALLGAPNSEGNKILDYTIEWVKGTYTFKITVRKYIFNGVLHTNTIYAEITLGASDLVYNRFDSFLIDANEQIIVWPGDAIEFPYPKEFDLDTYVLINFFRVDANTTEPVGISEIKVFDDGTGAPNEWTINYLSGTLSLEQASSGTKAIKLVNKQAVLATAAVPYEGRFLKDVIMKVFCATSANNRLRFSFWINDTMRVGEIYVSHGQFNFNAFLVGQWQTIVIPGSAFRNGETWGNYQYNSLWLNNDKSGTTVYLDDVRIQQTTSEQVSGATHTHSNLSVLEQITQTLFDAWNTAYNWVTTNGANVLFKADALTAVTPTNKLITQTDVAGLGGGDMLKSVYDPTVKNADAFSMGNMVETATKKVLTDTERSAISASKTKTDFLTITQAVDLDDIEIRVNNLDAAVVLKGAWDASVGTFPGAGIAQAGFSYQITVAGIVNGIDFSINDRIIALVDNASTTVYATNWLKADYSDLVASFNGRTGTIVLLNTDISDLMTASTAKATPVDTDIFSLFDTVLKKVTWANIKATLKTYFDTLYTKNFPDLTNKYDDYAWALSDVTTDLVAGDTSPVYATFPFTLNGFFVSVGTAPTGASIVVDLKKNGVSVTDGKAEVASLDITAAPTAIGNVVVGLNGVSTNVAVTIGVAEVSSLVFAGTVTTAGSVDISLNGVITSVAVALNDTAIMVADKIRAAVFTGWTTGGTAATDTVTFTSNTVGVKTDTTYSVGTSAGVTATVTTTTQGVDADTTTTVATKIRGTAFTGWITSGTGTNVVFTANTVGVKTDATYSAGTTGATGTIATTTQGVNKANAVIDATEFTSLTGTSPVVSVPTFVKGDKITAEIVQVGSTIAGKDLKIYLDITRV